MGYKTPAIKGITWMGVLRIASRGIAFVRLAILARILTPAQFGTFGIATLALSLLEVLTETGINVFLIQQKEKSDEYLSSAWIVSVLRGTLIAAILIILSPFISSFFNSPESLKLLLLIALVPFIRGFINPSIINIQKNIEFHKEFYLRSVLLFVDASVAIITAFITKSAESMAYGLIASAVVEVVLSFVLFKPWPIISFEMIKIKIIINRGWWVTASGIFNYFFHNLDKIAIGKTLNTNYLGIYQNAYNLSMLPITEIADVFSKVTFPVFARISNDRERLLKAFTKSILLVSALTIPFGAILVLFPEEIVKIVLGENWMSAASVIPILAVFGVLRAISGYTSVLFLSINKQEYVTIVTLVSLIGIAVPLMPLISLYGMQGAACSALVGSLVALPVMGYYTWKTFKLKNETS